MTLQLNLTLKSKTEEGVVHFQTLSIKRLYKKRSGIRRSDLFKVRIAEFNPHKLFKCINLFIKIR